MDNSFMDIPNRPLMNDSFVLIGQSAPSYTMKNLSKSPLHMDCLGSAMANCGHGDENRQSMNNITARDNGCRLVLGLGPTPDFYSTHCQPTGVYKSKESQTLSGQSISFTDPGMLRLGLQMDAESQAATTLYQVQERGRSAAQGEGEAEAEEKTRNESAATGSRLPDCTHACGPCAPCKRVMVSFRCARRVVTRRLPLQVPRQVLPRPDPLASS